MTLRNQEFVCRFSMHILPKRFVRIRHYGILSSSWKRGKLRALQKQLKVVRPPESVKTLLRKWPCCKTGTLITIEIFGKRGPPELYLLENPAQRMFENHGIDIIQCPQCKSGRMELVATYYHCILCKNEGRKSKPILIKNKDLAKVGYP